MVCLEACADRSWLPAQQRGLDVAALVLARASCSSDCPERGRAQRLWACRSSLSKRRNWEKGSEAA